MFPCSLTQLSASKKRIKSYILFMPFSFQFAAFTDTGRVRQHNEDAVHVFTLPDKTLVGLVCDGMGGHRGGALAAHTALDTIESFWRQHKPGKRAIREQWKEAFRKAQRQVSRHAESDPKLSLMGTTCTGVLLAPGSDQLYWANLGDSRLYLLRAGELSQISKDHTMVQRLVDEGEIRPEEAWGHPKGHILERVLTADNPASLPDTDTHSLKAHDCWLLCSDGLSAMLTDTQIRDILHRSDESLEETAQQLIQQANLAGGNDNISVALIRVNKQ